MKIIFLCLIWDKGKGIPVAIKTKLFTIEFYKVTVYKSSPSKTHGQSRMYAYARLTLGFRRWQIIQENISSKRIYNLNRLVFFSYFTSTFRAYHRSNTFWLKNLFSIKMRLYDWFILFTVMPRSIFCCNCISLFRCMRIYMIIYRKLMIFPRVGPIWLKRDHINKYQ